VSGFWDDAEVIHSYSREQALADGVLVDVSETGREAGFVWPVALTAALFALVSPTRVEREEGQDFEGRLWDVLNLAVYAIRTASENGTERRFTVAFREAGRDRAVGLYNEELLLVTGPGDEMEPVVTIGFPSDF
jgi:hypothetical protein